VGAATPTGSAWLSDGLIMRREPEFAGFVAQGVGVDSKLISGVCEPDWVLKRADEVVEADGGHSRVPPSLKDSSYLFSSSNP
jgi:hypothetical protein